MPSKPSPEPPTRTHHEQTNESTPLLVEQRSSIISDRENNVEDSDVIDLGDEDAEHPYNWPRWQTLSNCLLVSGMTFLTALASCEFYKKNHLHFSIEFTR